MPFLPSSTPHHVNPADGQPPARSHWKRNAAIIVVTAAAPMTYIEMALLGVGADAIHYDGAGRIILMGMIAIFAFGVNAFVAAVFTLVITIFVSIFGGGRRS
jgi:hypothetical protein